jgi:hypothetical protein
LSTRLKSELWVQALLRRNEVEGRFGAVVQKGASEAGTVFIAVNHLNGEFTLLGPPPGSAINERGERVFMREAAARLDWHGVKDRIARKQRADSDLWLVEVEDRDGLAGLSIVGER